MAEIQNIPFASYLGSARGKDVDSGVSLTTTTVCLDVVSTCKVVMFWGSEATHNNCNGDFGFARCVSRREDAGLAHGDIQVIFLRLRVEFLFLQRA